MNALQLEAAQRHVSHSGLFLPASNQNSVIAIRLINPDFQKGAIIW